MNVSSWALSMKSVRTINYAGMTGPIVRGKPTLTRAEYLQRQRVRVLRKVHERRAWLSEYRLAKGCADCGYRDHAAALDFDHNGTKKSFSIMRDGLTRSWGNLEAEVAKCDVVCANCHRVRTQQRLSSDECLRLGLVDEVR